MGPQGLPGEQGDRGILGRDGPGGPMGMAGNNATLRFINVKLFSNCTSSRSVLNLTSDMTRQNVLSELISDVRINPKFNKMCYFHLL